MGIPVAWPLRYSILANVVGEKNEESVATIFSLLVQCVQLIHENLALRLISRCLEDLVHCVFIHIKLFSNSAVRSTIVVVVERDNNSFDLPGEIVSFLVCLDSCGGCCRRHDGICVFSGDGRSSSVVRLATLECGEAKRFPTALS
jgi:DNA integrity scanning protein DisA with diadenylate cyclase activity